MNPNIFAALVFHLLTAWTAACFESVAWAQEPAGDQMTRQQVKQALVDPDWIVVDTRTPDAFNGWPLDGIMQGVHIPGSVDFSARWLNLPGADLTQRLQQVLAAKGIDATDNVVLYSIQASEREQVAKFLHDLGYQKVHLFDLQRWLDGGGQLENYPQYQRLVPPWIVKQLIDGQLPTTFEKSTRVKFVEVSWGDADASYTKGHVPGSFHVNTDHFEPPPKWYLGDRQLLTQFAADYGFQEDDTVIISGADVTASYRLCVVLLYMGIADVRVLNGGLAAWQQAGYDVETRTYLPHKSQSLGATVPRRQEMIIDIQQVKTAMRDPQRFSLIDTRTWAEFQGETSGYQYHSHKGRIPGSIYGQGNFRGPNSLTPYRNLDQTMRNFSEVKAIWTQAGIDTKKHLCFLCGGGWRAAEVLMYAQVAGMENSSLYSDGWIGWSNDPENPIESGPVK